MSKYEAITQELGRILSSCLDHVTAGREIDRVKTLDEMVTLEHAIRSIPVEGFAETRERDCFITCIQDGRGGIAFLSRLDGRLLARNEFATALRNLNAWRADRRHYTVDGDVQMRA